MWQGAKLEGVCAALRECKPLAVACRLQGHEPDGLEELMARDPEVKGAIERARSEGQAKLLEDMLSVSGPDGKTVVSRSTWLLERLNPKAFRPPPQKVEQEITGKNGGPVELGYSKTAARAELETRVRERYGDQADEVLALLLEEGPAST